MLKSGEWNRVVSHKIRWIPLRAMDFLCPIYVSRESCWKRLQLSHAPRHLRVVSEHLLGLSWCHRRACTTRAWICLVLIISTVETNQDKGCFSIVAKYYNVGGGTDKGCCSMLCSEKHFQQRFFLWKCHRTILFLPSVFLLYLTWQRNKSLTYSLTLGFGVDTKFRYHDRSVIMVLPKNWSNLFVVCYLIIIDAGVIQCSTELDLNLN